MKNKSELRLVPKRDQDGVMLTHEEARVLRALRAMTASERDVFLLYGEDRTALCLQQNAKQAPGLKVVK